MLSPSFKPAGAHPGGPVLSPSFRPAALLKPAGAHPVAVVAAVVHPLAVVAVSVPSPLLVGAISLAAAS